MQLRISPFENMHLWPNGDRRTLSLCLKPEQLSCELRAANMDRDDLVFLLDAKKQCQKNNNLFVFNLIIGRMILSSVDANTNRNIH